MKGSWAAKVQLIDAGLPRKAEPATGLTAIRPTIVFLAAVVFSGAAAEPPANLITTATLIRQMSDLERLASWPSPGYHTVQFSSYDRRSTTSEAPNWFANSDGFGEEPVPNFLKVLRQPSGEQPGLFLVAEAEGPGAIVRGWSAGMAGVLRVYLDPSPENAAGNLIWEGPAYDFLARRSRNYFQSARLQVEAGDAFTQEDADYLPIPFARGLRVTWEGKLNELHFYHLQVRLYAAGTGVRSFNPKQDLQEALAQIKRAVEDLLRPRDAAGEARALAGKLEPGRGWSWSTPGEQPGAIRLLRLRVRAGELDAVLRGCLLRISFDGSQRPQVEAPVGDFFGSGPGVNPFSSLPLSAEPDGTFNCRFVMPYRKSARIDVLNYTQQPVELAGSVALSPWTWDERSLYFRAKWRADHDLLAGAGSIDLPYLFITGKGVFAGCAAMIMNPSGVPTAGGNWWGEGDEKFLVDGESSPSTFGTGSEDYFNYSWSRPDLFAHPYCGQPLDSGPDTSGYISNHRFQIMDAIPFERSFAALMELHAHNRTPGLSYARIVYHYARPNATDDHRGLMPADLRIPPLPKRQPLALGGARGARFYFPDSLHPATSAGRLENVPCPLATQLQISLWRAASAEKLEFSLPMEKAIRASLHLVALHSPEGAVVRLLVDGKPLPTERGQEEAALRCAQGSRVLNVHYRAVEFTAGLHKVTLECTQAGSVGIDYIWMRDEARGP